MIRQARIRFDFTSRYLSHSGNVNDGFTLETLDVLDDQQCFYVKDVMSILYGEISILPCSLVDVLGESAWELYRIGPIREHVVMDKLVEQGIIPDLACLITSYMDDSFQNIHYSQNTKPLDLGIIHTLKTKNQSEKETDISRHRILFENQHLSFGPNIPIPAEVMFQDGHLQAQWKPPTYIHNYSHYLIHWTFLNMNGDVINMIGNETWLRIKQAKQEADTALVQSFKIRNRLRLKIYAHAAQIDTESVYNLIKYVENFTSYTVQARSIQNMDKMLRYLDKLVSGILDIDDLTHILHHMEEYL